MTTTLRPYLEYKETGLPWIGRIPTHWQVNRIKNLFRFINERSQSGQEILLSMGRHRGLTPFAQISARPIGPNDLIGFKITVPNDIVVNRMQACIGMFFRTPILGLVSPDYEVIRPKTPLVSSYFEQVFKLPNMQAKFRAESKGLGTGHAGFLRLYSDRLGAIHVFSPPSKEQNLIVAFLEAQERGFRKLIRIKKRLIELLNEQKSRLTDQILNLGVGADITLSASGIVDQAEMQRAWGVTRLKYVAKVQTGLTLGKIYGDVSLVTRPYLRVANVQSGYLNISKITRVQVPLTEAQGCELQVGDVLMTEGGDIDKLGRGCIWEGQIEGCLHQNHLFAVRTDHSRLLPPFLVLLMQSRLGRSYFERTAKKTTNLALTNSSILKAFPLPLPEVQVQREILATASLHTAEILDGVSRAQREIDLIHEYRTRLIADVVTGNLDVLEVAERLPSSAEQDALEVDLFDASL